jgi:serine incorporator 1/3
MMKMMKTTTMVTRVMTSVLAPVIMYDRFNTALTHLTSFQYSWFHIIFVLGAMYVAMLLTDWYEISRIFVGALITYTLYLRNFIRAGSSSPSTDGEDIYIGRSETAMWMRIVSSWVCMLLYIWSLLAPALMPDR